MGRTTGPEGSSPIFKAPAGSGTKLQTPSKEIELVGAALAGMAAANVSKIESAKILGVSLCISGRPISWRVKFSLFHHAGRVRRNVFRLAISDSRSEVVEFIRPARGKARKEVWAWARAASARGRKEFSIPCAGSAFDSGVACASMRRFCSDAAIRRKSFYEFEPDGKTNR